LSINDEAVNQAQDWAEMAMWYFLAQPVLALVVLRLSRLWSAIPTSRQ
jgi:hypothetical protein